MHRVIPTKFRLVPCRSLLAVPSTLRPTPPSALPRVLCSRSLLPTSSVLYTSSSGSSRAPVAVSPSIGRAPADTYEDWDYHGSRGLDAGNTSVGWADMDLVQRLKKRFEGEVSPRVVHPMDSTSTLFANQLASGYHPAIEGQQVDSCQAVVPSRSIAELTRSYFVLKISSVPYIARNSQALLTLSNKTLGPRLTNWAIKKTFFQHFCAGENATEVATHGQVLKERGIGMILNYAVEMGLEETSKKQATTDADSVVKEKSVKPAKGEEALDENAKFMLSAIDTAKSLENDGFVAMKVTALADPTMLFAMSEAIVAVKKELRRFHELGGNLKEMTMGELKEALLAANYQIRDDKELFGLLSMLHRNEPVSSHLAETIPTEQYQYAGDVDTFCRIEAVARSLSLLGVCKSISANEGSNLSEVSIERTQSLMARVRRIGKRAEEQQVKLLVDAEQSYFQPAIDLLTWQLQSRLNKESPVVFGTVQSYLRDSTHRLLAELRMAKHANVWLGVKLVRGAYMEEERKRAFDTEKPDPIHPNAASTHSCFDDNARRLLESRIGGGHVSTVIATHNLASILKVARLMQRFGLMPAAQGSCGSVWNESMQSGQGQSDASKTRAVYLAQLQGLIDHVTLALAQENLFPLKYVPYGPVPRTTPYLMRRANENLAVLTEGARKESDAVLSELKTKLQLAFQTA